MVLEPQRAAELQSQCKEAGICETVYLATCNRCELYGNGDYTKAIGLLARAAKTDPSLLKGSILVRQKEGAIRHLFHVASGMDSMVVGEDEILGQLKRAYLCAKDGGFTEGGFNLIFQSAFETAKRIKTRTLLSKSSVSIATLAAAQCHKFFEGRKKVLLMGGSGDTGRKVIKNLLSYGDCEITATVRQSHSLAEDVRIVPFGERYRYMEEADIIISATASPHYTVTRAMLKENNVTPKRRLFVDLAMPGDIDDLVPELEGSVLLRLDDFEEIARKNNEIKQSELKTAESILLEGVDELRKEIAFRDFYPRMSAMKDRLPKGIEQFIYRYRKTADADELVSFLGVLSRMEMEG